MKRISARDNPHYKMLARLLRNSRERRRSNLVVLDGMHLIAAYVSHGGVPEELVVSDSGAGRPEIADYLTGGVASATITVLSDSLFAALAVVDTPSGIMAIAPRPSARRPLAGGVDTVLFDGVQDPGNVGSILRSAAAAGFRQILLSTDCAQAWSPKTLRAAMGAHFQLDIHESGDLPSFLAAFGGQTVATVVDAPTSLDDADLGAPLAWIFGSEGQGVRPPVAAAAALRVRIPMPGATESLNVAAAAAVCLFETLRRRRVAARSALPARSA